MKKKTGGLKAGHWFKALLLTFVTLGFYGVYWFYSRREALNSMAVSKEKRISKNQLILLVVFAVAGLVVGVPAAIMADPELGGFGDAMWIVLDRGTSYSFWIMYVFLSFKAKDILAAKYRKVSFSNVLTFLFSVIYLQAKVDEIHRR